MTSTAHHDAPVLDGAALADLRELDEADGSSFVAEVTALFNRDFPVRATQLHAALAELDLATAAAVAHTIKGSCAAVGAQRMALLCEQIEGQIGRADHGGAAVAAARLTREYVPVKQALAESLGRTRSA